LLLDDDEAVAVAVGLRTAAGVAGIEETSVRASAKLEQVLPSRLRHRVHALQAATVAVPGAGPAVDADVLTAIATAIRAGERLRFDYTSHDRAASRRDVEPHRLVSWDRRWYLVAWDTGRDDWRTFRVDRIAGRPQPGARGTRREVPGGDAAAFVKRSIRGGEGDVVPGRIRLRAPAEVIGARVPARYATVAPDGPDACVVTTTGRWTREFLVWMAMMDAELTVLEPPELADEARRIVARLGTR
jgi:predicted DNA-binding transcriptional regulator YafY